MSQALRSLREASHSLPECYHSLSVLCLFLLETGLRNTKDFFKDYFALLVVHIIVLSHLYL